MGRQSADNMEAMRGARMTDEQAVLTLQAGARGTLARAGVKRSKRKQRLMQKVEKALQAEDRALQLREKLMLDDMSREVLRIKRRDDKLKQSLVELNSAMANIVTHVAVNSMEL